MNVETFLTELYVPVDDYCKTQQSPCVTRGQRLL